MTIIWQSCQGNYSPPSVFERDDMTVIAKNVKEIEDGLFQWDECSILTEDYKAICAIVSDIVPYAETNNHDAVDDEKE